MASPYYCVHCKTRKRTRPRGLCWTCWHDLTIRFRYAVGSANPATAKYAPRVPYGRGKGEHEPTMAELEQMIAEQLPTMPPT